MYKFEFTYHSLMQHYPLEPVGNHYPTASCPPNKDLIRAIGRNMGLKFDSDEVYESLKEKYTFSVKPAGKRQSVTIYTDSIRDEYTNEIKFVDYLVEAAFTVTVYGEKEDLLKANYVLKHPYEITALGEYPFSRFIAGDVEEVEE